MKLLIGIVGGGVAVIVAVAFFAVSLQKAEWREAEAVRAKTERMEKELAEANRKLADDQVKLENVRILTGKLVEVRKLEAEALEAEARLRALKEKRSAMTAADEIQENVFARLAEVKRLEEIRAELARVAEKE